MILQLIGICAAVTFSNTDSSAVTSLSLSNEPVSSGTFASSTITTTTTTDSPTTINNIPTVAVLPMVDVPLSSVKSLSTVIAQLPTTAIAQNIDTISDPIPTIHIGAAYADIQPDSQDVPQVTTNTQPTMNSTLFGDSVLSSASEISISLVVLIILGLIF